MKDTVALMQAVRDFEETLRSAAAAGTGDRPELVRHRRAIAQQIATISELALKAFAGSAAEPAFRAIQSEMRSALADHQASWPVVAIVADDPAYAASLQKTRSANQRYIDWIRRAAAQG